MFVFGSGFNNLNYLEIKKYLISKSLAPMFQKSILFIPSSPTSRVPSMPGGLLMPGGPPMPGDPLIPGDPPMPVGPPMPRGPPMPGGSPMPGDTPMPKFLSMS